jgi:hypothetical protein
MIRMLAMRSAKTTTSEIKTSFNETPLAFLLVPFKTQA